MRDTTIFLLVLLLAFIAPMAVSAVRYRLRGTGAGWQTADRSSVGHLTPARSTTHAVLRVFAAPTVRWRGIVASHCWIVFKSEEGSYRAWPGPNSNTFVAAVLDAMPGVKATLPPTAIGKDYPYDGRWFRRTSSRTGLALTLGGYAGLTVGWVEGVELSLLGLVVGVDVRRPALKLPGLGRIVRA